MVPLDPPFADDATVGGVIAANSSGPRRRLYGTARDLVIGMKFATLEGKLVQSGGMVVKNVAGLDMAKLMIGSFGTLAAIAVVNFKLPPMPEVERSFLLPFDSLADAIAARNRHPGGRAAARRDRPAESGGRPDAGQIATWLLALRAGGNAAAVDRYEARTGATSPMVWRSKTTRQQTLWRITWRTSRPQFLAAHAGWRGGARLVYAERGWRQ